MIIRRIAYFSLILILITGCGSDDDPLADNSSDPDCDSTNPTAYIFDLPDHIPAFDEPDNNPTTLEGVALGKRLYHDRTLSQGGPLAGHACADCHQQETNFSNHASGTSVMPHTNLHWSSFWLWDGAKSGDIEDVMLFEVSDFFQTDTQLINADTVYREMNCDAFGRSELTALDMGNAISQWVRTLISYRSKFDEHVSFDENDDLVVEDLSELEMHGYELYTGRANCSKCHTLPLTTDHTFHNNGLDSDATLDLLVGSNPDSLDLGHFRVTQENTRKGWFKTPSLRNAAVTAPYMHDGRFATLMDVINFYSTDVNETFAIDPVIFEVVVEQGDYNLRLSDYDKTALVAFLETFTDEKYLSDPEFSNPFETE